MRLKKIPQMAFKLVKFRKQKPAHILAWKKTGPWPIGNYGRSQYQSVRTWRVPGANLSVTPPLPCERDARWVCLRGEMPVLAHLLSRACGPESWGFRLSAACGCPGRANIIVMTPPLLLLVLLAGHLSSATKWDGLTPWFSGSCECAIRSRTLSNFNPSLFSAMSRWNFDRWHRFQWNHETDFQAEVFLGNNFKWEVFIWDFLQRFWSHLQYTVNSLKKPPCDGFWGRNVYFSFSHCYFVGWRSHHCEGAPRHTRVERFPWGASISKGGSSLSRRALQLHERLLARLLIQVHSSVKKVPVKETLSASLG